MISDKKLKYITTVNGIDFYEYRVRLFSYFYQTMAGYEKRLTRSVRETIDYLRDDYKVVYMGIDDTLIGHGVITRGGGRNKFCTNQDIVLCSLFVRPEMRGNGYANVLVRMLATGLGIGHCAVYEYIRHDNIPSVKVALANGFTNIGNATYKGLLKKIVFSENGQLGIYEKRA